MTEEHVEYSSGKLYLFLFWVAHVGFYFDDNLTLIDL